MEMARFLLVKTWAVHFVLYIFLSETSSALFAQTNGNITLKTNFKQQIQEILWKFNGHKVLDWDKYSDTIQEYLQFKGRTYLVRETGDLTIYSLKSEDSGSYEAELVVDDTIHAIKHNVKIIDPVSKTSISCTISNGIKALLCRAEGPHLSYSWSGPGCTTEMNDQIGPIISIVETYTCVVRNPVSEETIHFQADECFTDEETKNSQQSGNTTVIALVVTLCVVVLALAVTIVRYCYLKKKYSRGDKHLANDEEATPLKGNKPAAEKEDGQEQTSVAEYGGNDGGDETQDSKTETSTLPLRSPPPVHAKPSLPAPRPNVPHKPKPRVGDVPSDTSPSGSSPHEEEGAMLGDKTNTTSPTTSKQDGEKGETKDVKGDKHLANDEEATPLKGNKPAAEKEDGQEQKSVAECGGNDGGDETQESKTETSTLPLKSPPPVHAKPSLPDPRPYVPPKPKPRVGDVPSNTSPSGSIPHEEEGAMLGDKTNTTSPTTSKEDELSHVKSNPVDEHLANDEEATPLKGNKPAADKEDGQEQTAEDTNNESQSHVEDTSSDPGPVNVGESQSESDDKCENSSG